MKNFYLPSVFLGVMFAFFLLVVPFYSLCAQTPDPYQQRMNYIFANVNKSYISSGFLIEYGVEFVTAANHAGVITSSNYADMLAWRSLYASIRSAKITTSASILEPDVIDARIESYSSNSSLINLPIFFYNYHSLRTNAVSSGTMRVQNDQLYDVTSSVTNNPYTQKTAFIIAPTSSFSRNGVASFIFRPELFFTNTGRTVTSIQVDFDNGAGYMNVSWNVPITISYSSVGNKHLRYRVTFSGGVIMEGHSWFQAVTSSVAARYQNPNTTANADSIFFAARTNVHSGGRVDIRYSNRRNGSRRIVKPLIVVEGYDISFIAPRIARESGGNFNIRDFLLYLNDDNARWPQPNAINNAFDFNQALDDIAGYDLIFVDFRDGTDDIRRNAALVQEVIQQVNARKVLNAQGRRDSNVVMGLSMGGLVARYALCDMARQNLNSETRLFISHDSPHRGANVPLGFQAMINEIAGIRITDIPITFILPQLGEATRLLDAPASRQMLIYQDQGRVNTFLDGEYRTMVNRMIPGCRMIATSLGNQCAQLQPFQPYGELLKIKANAYASRLLIPFLPIAGLIGLPMIQGRPSNLFDVMKKGAIGLVAGTAAAGALIFLGDKNWKVDFIVNALPDRQVQRIFYGNVSVEKKILFLIPVSVTLWQRQRNSAATMLAVDNAPGSYYPTGDIKAYVPDNPNINLYPIVSANLEVNIQERFCFVAVASALDVPVLDANALSYRFINNLGPTGNASRFANYLANQTFNEVNTSIPVSNHLHISFTQQNSQWLYYEMERVAGNTFNCANECTIAPVSQVSGAFPTTTCGVTEADFSVPTISGVTYQWSTSSTNLQILSGQGTPTVRIRRNASCQGCQIIATIRAGCGSFTVRKTLNGSAEGGGGYSSSDYPVSGPDQASCGQSVYYSTVSLPGATNYQWVNIPSGATNVSGQGTRYLSFTVPPNTYGMGVGVRVANACDAGGSPAIKFTSVSCSGYSPYVVYPNPSSSELTIERVQPEPTVAESINTDLKGQLSVQTANANETFLSVKLLNYYNETVAIGKIKGARIKLDVSKLPTGVYYLQVQYGDLPSVNQQVVIVH